ncbi:hypothetical protein [Streptomyces camelliae]|uniref:MarR family transcriptional regulator n=1 Tax=Streptomyces camelliae TaxID=3004093 RepID=A0ABY7P442_9ACTN|nr:hypothetical protein [Streptomyces sp. HUAS 2-6]WBO64093.1 hypothetical protein O1G22_15265 [Streptomyces sp. HUAS 2-6]
MPLAAAGRGLTSTGPAGGPGRPSDAYAAVTEAGTAAVRVERALAAEFTDAERDALTGLLARCVSVLEEQRPGSS